MSRTVWCIAEYEQGRLHRGAAELVSAAREIGEEAVIVVPGGEVDAIAAQAAAVADRVLVVADPALEPYSADAWAQALTQLARERGPAAILLPHAPLGRELGPILAARLASGMISDCVALAWQEGLVGTRSVYFRKLLARERVVADGPAVATCQRGAFVPAEAQERPAPIERAAVQIDASRVRSRLLGVEQAEPGEEDLTEAEIVVAGGRGLGDADKFELVRELARALGGVMGASRPVVDQGWVGHERQIGSSGVTVRPKLYVAVGISGAIQHVVGMRESDVIVAINKDPQAPIFEYAHYGIVDDLFKVVPALIEELRRG